MNMPAGSMGFLGKELVMMPIFMIDKINKLKLKYLFVSQFMGFPGKIDFVFKTGQFGF